MCECECVCVCGHSAHAQGELVQEYIVESI